MASIPHRYHPDADDDPEAILWDDCDACCQNACSPLTLLDRQNIARIQDRIRNIVGGVKEDRFRSQNEILAAGVLYSKYREVFGDNVIEWPLSVVPDRLSHD